MNISYKCKCGRTTTYGLKCISCSGSAFDFVTNPTIEPVEEEEEELIVEEEEEA
jgi:hypothetical protein